VVHATYLVARCLTSASTWQSLHLLTRAERFVWRAVGAFESLDLLTNPCFGRWEVDGDGQLPPPAKSNI